MSTAAIAKLGSPGAIANVQALVARMRDIQDAAFVCSPFANLDSLPEFFRVSERVIAISPDPTKGEIYISSSFCRAGECALSKPALLKIWLASGGKIVASRRTDDRSNRHICSWTVEGEIRQIDGNVVRMIGSRTLDFDKDSDQIKGLKDGDIAQKRRVIESLAETFAMERMIRSLINLQQKYLVKDVGEKPFVCYALVPDSSRCDDPVIRRLFAAEALGVTEKLFGPGAPVRMIETADGTVNTATGEIVEPKQIAARAEEAVPDDLPPPPPPAELAPIVCGCPCGDQHEVKSELAAWCETHLGAPRCPACIPGERFQDAPHLSLSTLALPKRPDFTPAKAAAYRMELERKKGGR